jgi:hypothetical protein
MTRLPRAVSEKVRWRASSLPIAATTSPLSTSCRRIFETAAAELSRRRANKLGMKCSVAISSRTPH